MSEHEPIMRASVYVLYATAYALAGYLANVVNDDDVDFNPVRFGKTVAIGIVAGVAMIVMDDIDGVDAAIAIAIPIVDKIWNAAANYREEHATSRF